MSEAPPGGGGAPPDGDVEIVCEVLSGVPNPVALQIQRRAELVSRPRIWWSIADWLAWGWHTQTKITVLIGHGHWNLFEFLTSPAITKVAATWTRHIHVIGCKVNRVSEHWSEVSHWIYCLPVGKPVFPPDALEFQLPSFTTMRTAQHEVTSYYNSLGYCVLQGRRARLVFYVLGGKASDF